MPEGAGADLTMRIATLTGAPSILHSAPEPSDLADILQRAPPASAECLAAIYSETRATSQLLLEKASTIHQLVESRQARTAQRRTLYTLLAFLPGCTEFLSAVTSITARCVNDDAVERASAGAHAKFLSRLHNCMGALMKAVGEKPLGSALEAAVASLETKASRAWLEQCMGPGVAGSGQVWWCMHEDCVFVSKEGFVTEEELNRHVKLYHQVAV